MAVRRCTAGDRTEEVAGSPREAKFTRGATGIDSPVVSGVRIRRHGRRQAPSQKGGTMSSRRLRFVLPAVLVLGLVAASFAIAAGQDHGSGSTQFTAKLIGHNDTLARHTAGGG